ncbi:MAG: DUF1499 domain-containing protein [Acidobacteria bacterium]|nr:MAG: DUF1499 domain-containing protein [Acidobacteriota bacterium]
MLRCDGSRGSFTPGPGRDRLESSSRAAHLAAMLGLGALAVCALVPVVIQLGLASPMGGFKAFMLGNLLALAALVTGMIGVWSTRVAAGRSGRGRALIGLAVSANISAGFPPRINDITTDTEDPPAFQAARTLDANRGRDLSYPGESFASLQRSAYPDLAPIEVSRSPAKAFDDVRRVAAELGWEITAEDTDAGTIEATDTSRVFRFIDDISIRIRPSSSGARIDMRSKSRDGQGDIGANAARIRAFRKAIDD